MKTLSTLFENVAKTARITVDANAVNYLSVSDLKTYLKVANKFLSDDAKDVIDYLIVNNTTYISDLSTDNEENALAGFFNAGKPNKDNLTELYNHILAVVKSGRVLEIPVFQTKEQFDSIINKTLPADRIILDFDSENGRNEIVKMYTPLLHKICRQWMGKSTFTYDDLMSAAQTGIIYAMDHYGNKSRANDDYDAIANYTFGQYAAMTIRNAIIADIRAYSHTVSIPVNKQAEEKKTKGYNTKYRSVSGDKKVGINNSDEGNKTIFDFIEVSDDVMGKLNNDDIKKLWNEIWDELEKNLDKTMMEIFYSFYGLNGRKKLKNKELADKFHVSNSSVSYYCYKVREYISSHKSIINRCKEIYSLMSESLSVEDTNNNIIYEPLQLK